MMTSGALLNHTRAVDRVRLISRLVVVEDCTLDLGAEAIKISLGLIRF